jgi:hypothetical protein
VEKKIPEMKEDFGVQSIGFSLTNGGPFIFVQDTEQVAFLQGDISITDSKDNSTDGIVKRHLDKYADAWQALA